MTKKNLLTINRLTVETKGKKILDQVNLIIRSGEIHVLLGPNASGKTTLAQTIMGFPNYKVKSGKIYFDSQEITALPTEKRVALGIALAFQHPPVIRGVSLNQLVEKIRQKKINPADFKIPDNLMKREVNLDFSGGERKLSEIMQIVSLKPRLVILDELDAGLDLKNIIKISRVIKDSLVKNGVALLVITHQGDILRFLNPNVAHVMLNKKIICSSNDWKKVWQTIEKFDYEKCKECRFSAN